ncbi:recombination-associated protein RdgC [Gallionella capsiferriformans]|uniref:Recombination-associated protein RdgC n=1 Tax=Gallionella capsiferriformans (strain ES-2) TaxID=395494 RepID=D9SIW5_GALCS|nr:recombination-associated protein RdgC [Gallionella capsiferriformans]ADL54241.1 exonuclease RdgC [Gallionella capsiferriformans ES-2]
MWFKNIFIYRLPVDCAITAAALQEKLALKPLLPCSGLDKQSRGWVSCRGDDRLVHAANGQILFALGVEQKLLPATIITRFAKERVADIEAQQGYKVGRKEMKDLKEAITEELLPRAFALLRTTYAWIDTANGFLVIDAASAAKAEELLEFLNKTLDDLPVKPLHTELSPVAAMTDWLAGEAAPAGFTIDRELELRATGESRATVRYANHALEGDEILAHIAAGKRATRLGLTWNDRVSFVLTEQLQIKRLEFLDIIKEESTTLADTADELFELDFTLMTGELAKMLVDLTDALGGEKSNQ